LAGQEAVVGDQQDPGLRADQLQIARQQQVHEAIGAIDHLGEERKVGLRHMGQARRAVLQEGGRQPFDQVEVNGQQVPVSMLGDPGRGVVNGGGPRQGRHQQRQALVGLLIDSGAGGHEGQDLLRRDLRGVQPKLGERLGQVGIGDGARRQRPVGEVRPPRLGEGIRDHQGIAALGRMARGPAHDRRLAPGRGCPLPQGRRAQVSARGRTDAGVPRQGQHPVQDAVDIGRPAGGEGAPARGLIRWWQGHQIADDATVDQRAKGRELARVHHGLQQAPVGAGPAEQEELQGRSAAG
jgi:hypothetical protein